MAKERQNNSLKDAVYAITSAVRAEVNGELDPAQKALAINQAMDVVDNSNLVTLAENADEAIELGHQIEEATAEATAKLAADDADGIEVPEDIENAQPGDGIDADDAEVPPF